MEMTPDGPGYSAVGGAYTSFTNLDFANGLPTVGTYSFELQVTDGTGVTVTSNPVTVEVKTMPSSITLSESTGYVGDSVTVTGVGFFVPSSITITFDGVTQTTVPYPVFTYGSDTGSFSATFTVPAHAAGGWLVYATDSYGDFAYAQFTLNTFASTTFTENGLPAGTSWSVTIGGKTPSFIEVLTTLSNKTVRNKGRGVHRTGNIGRFRS